MSPNTEVRPTSARAGSAGGARPARTVQEAAGVALAFALVYPWLLPPMRAIGSAGDDGVYVALGRALASGQGYRSIYAVGAPAHVKFPPLLPFVYAFFWRLGADLHDMAILARGLNVAALAGAVGLLWWLARTRLAIGRTATALLVVGPLFLDSMLQYAGLALSEPCFVLGWAAALVLAGRARRPAQADGPESREPQGAGPVWGAGLGVVLGLTTLVRTQAVVLLPAFWLALALLRARRAALLTSVAVSAAVPVAWLLLRPLLAGTAAGAGVETGYLGDLGGGGPHLLGLLSGAAGRLRLYVSIFAPYLAPAPRLGGVLVGLYLALALLGLARLRSREPALVLSVAATALVVLLWPYTIDRFVLSLLPFMGLGAAFWVERELAGRKRLARIALLVMALVAAGAVAVRQVHVRRMGAAAAREDRAAQFWTPSYTIPAVSRYIRAASAWVMGNTAPGTRVVAAWPEGIYLLTGRSTVNLEPAESSLRRSVHADSGRYLARAIALSGATVVIVWDGGSPSERELSAVLKACPAGLRSAGNSGPRGYPRFFLAANSACLRRMSSEPVTTGLGSVTVK